MDDRLTARELRRVERIKSALALEESLADDDDYDDDEIDAAAAVVRPDEAAEVGGVDDVDVTTRAWSRRVSGPVHPAAIAAWKTNSKCGPCPASVT